MQNIPLQISILEIRYNSSFIHNYPQKQEYSGSTANILTAVLCAGLFPDKFELTVYIMLSMTCLLTGIYLYESKKIQTPPADSKENKNNSNTT